VQTLRLASDLGGSANAVAIYQASQDIYNIFDKATVLYEGRQIYFGPAATAKSFFEKQGWHCPQRQTTGDFLTSVTNPEERRARQGMEDKVPRTPDEFEQYWRRSPEYQALMGEIDEYERNYPSDRQGESLVQLRHQKNYAQARFARPKSPYTISVAQQIGLCTRRAYQRIMGDISATATTILINIVLSLVLGSVFFNTPDATAGFSSKGAVLFMGVLLSALSTISEINSLYSQRPIVEKHASYAFYHPATEAIAGIIAEIPIKFCTSVVFNLILYFISGLRREAAQFFLYFLVTYVTTLVMSAAFRTMAALTKTVSQAMALAGVLSLALVMYTGYVIAVPQMGDWFSWIRWINPIFYAFEILIANEFHGREFTCSDIVPSYTPLVGDSWICSAVGSVTGRRTVSGDAYIAKNYQYYYSNVWRNFGILLAFLFGLMAIYFAATEWNSSTTSTAEVLVFQRGYVPEYLQEDNKQKSTDEEKGVAPPQANQSEQNTSVRAIKPQKDIFTWRDVVYDIEIKGKPRRLLDHVSGWVQPGTLTALMGVSGAGKTTLLDVLAQRITMGVITGDMFVNGKPLDASFQRKTGYVQQQGNSLPSSNRFSLISSQTCIWIPPLYVRACGSVLCSVSLHL
jgi:ABC-type multidrug transport system permease subunit/ABC-type multidrug transport system ATPase subunit